MAAIHHISLDTYNGGFALAAVVFNLHVAAPADRLFSDLDGWEVELRAGCASVVARTADDLTDIELHERAINVTGKALDRAAVMDFEALLLKKPGDDFAIFRRSIPVRLRLQNVVDFGVAVGPVGVTITRADGTIERPVPQDPVWSPAFRFYRLSQASNDLFEAYRNLFLALEALLDQLFPKRSNEGEKAWLVRAFKEAATLVDFSSDQQAADPISDLVKRFYAIRLNLFHAKQGKTFVPEVGANYLEVSEAYNDLVGIWRKIVEKFLNASPRGGALTRGGFRMMLEPFAETHVAVSADVTPVSKEQTDFSPSGKSVHIFQQKVSMTEDRPGRILLSSVESIAEAQVTTIGRMGIVKGDGTPALVSDDFGQIDIEGVEQLEIRFLVRLVNKKQPRTEF